MPEQQPEAPGIRVSIIIVTHNQVAALRRALSAIEASADRPRVEVIVVDNGSRDGCQSIDSEFPHVTVLRLPHHCGLAKPRNIGIRTAKGEFILLLSPAVALESSAPTRLADHLEGDSSALAVIPLLVNEAGDVVTKVRKLPSPEQTKTCWRDPAGLPSVPLDSDWDLHDGYALLIRKRSIQGINYLDEKYGEYWVDVELAYQIRRAGKRIALATDVKGTLFPMAQVLSRDAGIRASFAADAANGAAVYLAKRFGFLTGFTFRLQMVLLALLRLLTMQDPAYALALLSRLSSGYKIDGKTLQFN
jgi:hypothetical protein